MPVWQFSHEFACWHSVLEVEHDGREDVRCAFEPSAEGTRGKGGDVSGGQGSGGSFFVELLLCLHLRLMQAVERAWFTLRGCFAFGLSPISLSACSSSRGDMILHFSV